MGKCHLQQRKRVWYRGRTNTTTFVEYLEAALNSRRRRLRGYYSIRNRPTWAHIVLAHGWLHSQHIRCMDNYPAMSPDLNPIESVWNWMNRYVQRNHPNS